MKKVFFASDFHLGIAGKYGSRERERQVVRWLDQIEEDALEILLVGDLFDFWFEYRTAVPKGYVRLLGKIAELQDKGIPISIFTGNHDIWMFRYFEEELGVKVFRKPIIRQWNGKTFFIGHGDGLGPGDYGYKFIKKIFSNRLCQWLYARLHPNFGIPFARFWSGTSRQANPPLNHFLGEDREWLIRYANSKSDEMHVDYFIFGHRHFPMDYKLRNGVSRYINLGEWLFCNSFAVFDGQDVQIQFFENEEGIFFKK